MIRTFQGITPTIPGSCFIEDTSVVIGDVVMGEQCSIWFNTVIRGDVHYIRLGNRTNVQDLCMLHVTHETHPLIIGSDVTSREPRYRASRVALPAMNCALTAPAQIIAVSTAAPGSGRELVIQRRHDEGPAQADGYRRAERADVRGLNRILPQNTGLNFRNSCQPSPPPVPTSTRNAVLFVVCRATPAPKPARMPVKVNDRQVGATWPASAKADTLR